LLHGMGSISHRFTTPMDQSRTKFIARRNGRHSWGGSEMTNPIPEASPRFKARIAGVFYLLTILTGIFAEIFVRGRLVVDGDAAATATNILAHEPLFRLALVVDLIPSYIVVTILFLGLS
jgi:Domain of unknown function (DUF4386)